MAYKTVNPYTTDVEAEFPSLTSDELDAKLATAHAAFEAWKDQPVSERTAVLAKAAQILRDKKRYFAEILTHEMGKIIGEAEAEVELSADIMDYYVGRAEDLLAPRKLEVSDAEEGSVYLQKAPLGVLFAVEPWNFPYYQLARVAAPQLAAGNTLVVKHASNVPQSALAFEQLMRDAGAPEGVYTALLIPHDMSEQVIGDPRVRGVALTGSEGAGRSIAMLAAKYLKKSTLELGGADAFVVLEDADVQKAADWAVYGRHWNAGQVCVSAKRLIVVDAVYDKFVELYKAGAEKLKAGDPLDPATTLAPMSSHAALETLNEQIKEAADHGATVTKLDVEIPAAGEFAQPVLIENITPENPAYTTEFFGPAAQVYRAKDEADAIRIANDSPFGLGGSVFTEDEDRGRRVAEEMETGMVFINHPTAVKADIPFGGVKNSGYGHELIDLGFNEFLNLKVVDTVDVNAAF